MARGGLPLVLGFLANHSPAQMNMGQRFLARWLAFFHSPRWTGRRGRAVNDQLKRRPRSQSEAPLFYAAFFSFHASMMLPEHCSLSLHSHNPTGGTWKLSSAFHGSNTARSAIMEPL
jgi:hypothetical protein